MRSASALHAGADEAQALRRRVGGPIARALVVAVATAVVAAACGGSPGTATGPAAVVSQSRIDWRRCGALDCATVPVPVDPAAPAGATVALAVTRHRATGDRIGVLFVNPGGPGGSGTAVVGALAQRSAVLRDRFDLLGWDPRGVAGPSELVCDDPLIALYAADPSPDDPAEQQILEELAAAAAEACADAAPELLGTLGTSVAAADLDALRAALGEERISYLGFSYGTDLGLVYAAAHGEHLRGAVLDGVLDPTLSLETWLTGQAVATEATLIRTLGPAIDTFDAVIAGAESTALAVEPAEVARAAIAASYDRDGAAALRAALEAALDGRPEALRGVAASYLSGSSFDVYTAVTCIDRPHPDSADAYRGLASRLAAASPRLGAVIANELLPCAYWAVPPKPPLATIDQRNAPPMLIVANTGDSATPYDGAVVVAARLERSVLLTHFGEGHTSYLGGSSCVDAAVEDYLVGLTLPAPGTTCVS